MASATEGIHMQLESVRAAARAAFEAHTAKARATARAGPLPPPTRVHQPGLREALLLHACRHAAARGFELHARRWKRVLAPRALGSAAPRPGALWRWRCERVICAAIAQKSRSSPLSHPAEVSELAVGLPAWIRTLRAAACARAQAAAVVAKQHATIISAAITAPPRAALAPLHDTRGYAQHVARASAARAAGLCALCTRSAPASTPRESPAELTAAVALRYAGRPDELYRRQSGRRFAAHRRACREAAVGRATKELKAEAEMARRRGGDRLRSAPGAPRYVFDGGDHAYVYGSRISQAPRLRESMLRKYSAPAPQPLAPVPDALQIAKQCAESRPMFHTRVMNRFG